MNSSNNKNELKINNIISNSSRAKTAKLRRLRNYDEVERKDIIIKNKTEQIKKIKTDTIKELIYTNQKVPKNWQKQKNYQNQIYEIFSKNPKFLSYLGRNSSNKTEVASYLSKDGNDTKKYYSLKDKINTKDINCNTKLFNKMKYHFKKKLNLSPISESINCNNEIKYMNTAPSKLKYNHNRNNSAKSKEILNILDDLEKSYPIKDKINDLFSSKEIAKLSLTERNYNPIISPRKRKQVFKNNIYLNLVCQKNKKHKNMKLSKENYETNFNLAETAKAMIKNPVVYEQLDRINFYGPFYSYCHDCGVRNFHFYQKLPLKLLNNITNQIKKYRNLI